MISVFKKLSWYFKEQWLKYTLAISALIVVNILGVIPPILVGRVIDLIQYEPTHTGGFHLLCCSVYLHIGGQLFVIDLLGLHIIRTGDIIREENAFKANGPFYANDIAFLRTISNGRFDGS